MHLLFGTTQGQNDILNITAGIGNESGIYFIDYDGHHYLVNGIQAELVVNISQQQYNQFSVATLYVVNTAGLASESIYFNK